MIVFILLFGAAAIWAQEEQPAEETVAAEATATEGTAASEEPEVAESQMSFEDTLDFETGTQIDLDVLVGEVDVRGIEFLVSDYKPGFISGTFSSGNDDLESELTVRLNMATSADKKQKIGVVIELLDGDGKLIDRTGNNFNFKDRSKIFTFKHLILKWAMERVEQVKIRAEARN
jgi:hypothetical protein